MTNWRLILLLVVLAAVLAGCQNKAENEGSWLGATKTDDPAQHPGSAGGTAVVPSASAGTTVLVMLEDRHIAVRESAIPPGPAVFTITNGGSELHNLYIEGPGVKTTADGPIEEKGSRSVTADLQAGTYTLYCPILDHRANGETATLTVRQ